MLILTRKIGDKVIIQDNINIVILSMKGNQVRLGIDAPREITVHREEIYQRIIAGKQSTEKEQEIFTDE